ncbi:MAG: hypothetical protein ACR2NN_25480 [Bryobacteraceae bacterium]
MGSIWWERRVGEDDRHQPPEGPQKMARRLGGIQARHSQVNDRYEIAVSDTAEGVRLTWQMKEGRKNWRELREGAYMLRTNLKAATAEELWSRYTLACSPARRPGKDLNENKGLAWPHPVFSRVRNRMQLTEAEASFRALKSELSIRPLFHQLEPRVKTHVMVAFLGYAMWVTPCGLRSNTC